MSLRGFVVSSCVAVLLFGIAVEAASDADRKVSGKLGADWPSWRGAERDGKVADFEAPATWPKELVRGWSVEVGTGHSTPALVAGRLYVHARQADDQEVVLALDAATGKEIWRQSTKVPYTMDPTATEHGKGPKASVSVVDGRVFTFGVDGLLSCLDAATGKVHWQHDFKSGFPKPSPRYGVAMTPLVVGNRLIAHVGGDEKGAIRAYDIATGETLWSWDGDGPAYASPITATVDGTTQVITQTREYAVGLGLEDGKEIWKIEYKTNFEQNSVTPIVHDGNVILSGYHVGITAFPLAGGVKENNDAWSTTKAAMYMSSPILDGDVVYGFSEKRRGQLFALDAKTGEILWTGERREGENAALVAAGDVLLSLDTDAELIVVRKTPDDYEELARYEVSDKPVWAHPVVSGNTIFVKDETTLTQWIVTAAAEATSGGD